MPSRRSKPVPPAAKPTTLQAPTPPAPTPPTNTRQLAGSDGDNDPPRKKRRMDGDTRGVGGENRGTDGDPRWIEGTWKPGNVSGSTRDAGHLGSTENSAEGGEQDSGEDSDIDSSDDPADGEDEDSEAEEEEEDSQEDCKDSGRKYGEEDSEEGDSEEGDSEEEDEEGIAGYHSREEEEPTAILSAFSVPSRVRRKAAGRGSAEPAPAAIISDNPRLSAPLDSRTAFSSLGIDPWLVRSLANMAIHRPTGIQKSCIPEILRGRDCIGGSRTGSGKTVAFAVPILQIWAEDPSAIFAVVLTPTRELALQIYEQFRAISSPHTLKALLITGGADMRAQTIALAQRPHVVISTPGRLADLVRTSGEDTICGFKRVRFVVLDEADRLLDPTMLSDVEECLSALPPADQRQTLLFTATMTAEVRALRQMPARTGKQRPFVCEIDGQALAVPSSLRQMFLKAPVTHREHYLHTFLSTAANAERTMIIFCNRTATAEYIHHLLRLLDHRVTALHSRLPQRQRTDNLARFRAGAARILVATDVASRGLDIPECSLVLNYDVPRDPDDYIHRVGRTARAGRRGDAVTFVGQRDVDLVLAIEARVGGGGMEEWAEEGVNLDSRVGRDALRLVTEKKREALLEIEEDRDVGGKRRMTKQKLRV